MAWRVFLRIYSVNVNSIKTLSIMNSNYMNSGYQTGTLLMYRSSCIFYHTSSRPKVCDEELYVNRLTLHCVFIPTVIPSVSTITYISVYFFILYVLLHLSFRPICIRSDFSCTISICHKCWFSQTYLEHIYTN